MAKDAHVVVVGVSPEVFKKMSDAVNSPKHYNVGKIEVIDAIEDWKLAFNLGNVVKYVARAWHKGKYVEDLKKAAWYLQREIDHAQGDVVPLLSNGDAVAKLSARVAELEAQLETERDMVRDRQRSLDAAIERGRRLSEELSGAEERLAEMRKPEPVVLQTEGFPLAGALADAVVNEFAPGVNLDLYQREALAKTITKFANRYFANAQDTHDKYIRVCDELHQLRQRTHKARLDALIACRQLATFHDCATPYTMALDNLIELNKARREKL